MSSEIRKRKNVKTVEEIEEKKNFFRVAETKHSWNYFLISIFFLISILIISFFRSPFAPKVPKGLQLVDLKGPLEINSKMTQGKRYEGLPGPESIVEDDGVLITGLLDGRIVKILPSVAGVTGEGKIINITSGKIKGAKKTSEDINHGRPLGLRLRGSILYVADAIYGILEVDILTKATKVLIPPSKGPLSFPNDLDVSKDGIIYFTDTSPGIPLTRIAHAYLSGECRGRLYRFDPHSDNLDVIVSDLCAPNGVQLSKDQSKIVVVEGSANRIIILEVGSWKVLKSFQVPVSPDNVRLKSNGNFVVAGGHVLGPVGFQLQSMTSFKQILLGIFHHETLLALVKKFALKDHGMIIEFDEEKILRSIHDKGGRLTKGASQITELKDGRFAVGSYFANFLVILNSDVWDF